MNTKERIAVRYKCLDEGAVSCGGGFISIDGLTACFRCNGRIMEYDDYAAMTGKITDVTSSSDASRDFNFAVVQIRGITVMECYKGHTHKEYNWSPTQNYICDECGNTLVATGPINCTLPVKPAPFDATLATNGRVPSGCSHSWVPYVGLWETYEYCKTCDVKREALV